MLEAINDAYEMSYNYIKQEKVTELKEIMLYHQTNNTIDAVLIFDLENLNIINEVLDSFFWM